MAKKRRRRKKSSSGGAAIALMTLNPGEVPSDEQLEQEAAELEKELDSKTQKRYDDAKKKGLDLASLQHMKGSELVKLAVKEKIDDASTLPKQKLVFEILKARNG